MRHLETFFQDIVDKGGEGIILRDPTATLQPGRAPGYLKHKVANHLAFFGLHVTPIEIQRRRSKSYTLSRFTTVGMRIVSVFTFFCVSFFVIFQVCIGSAKSFFFFHNNFKAQRNYVCSNSCYNRIHKEVGTEERRYSQFQAPRIP